VPTSGRKNDTPTEPTGKDPATQLRDIRAKVTSLQRRIKTERDPKLVAELGAQVMKLSELLSVLIDAAGKDKSPVTKANPVVWPRDITTETREPGEWGADPTEVGGE
jgi:hypothetical protein